MHIRQLFVAGIILFGTAQMEAGKNGKQKGCVNTQKGVNWKLVNKIRKASKKHELSRQEQDVLDRMHATIDKNSSK